MGRIYSILSIVFLSFYPGLAMAQGPDCTNLLVPLQNIENASEKAFDIAVRTATEINRINHLSGSTIKNPKMTVLVEMNQDTGGLPTQITARYNKRGLVLVLKIHPELLVRPEMVYKDLLLLEYLSRYRIEFLGAKQSDSSQLVNPQPRPYWYVPGAENMAELMSNSISGEKRALYALLDAELNLLKNSRVNERERARLQKLYDRPFEPQEIINQRVHQLEAQIDEIEKQKVEEKKLRESQWRNLKKLRGPFDGIQFRKTLVELVMANNRAGVRHLFEEALPWPLMSPVEKRAWQVWLDAIEFPSEEHEFVGFRGNIGSRMNEVQDAGLLRQKPDGTYEFGMVSTLFSVQTTEFLHDKNPLELYRQKLVLENEFSRGVIEKMMGEHAHNNEIAIRDHVSKTKVPIGSAFMSFSLEPWVATQYSSDQGSFFAVKIDSRRLIPNLVNSYTREVEVLAPLIVFPEEVVFFKMGQYYNEAEFESDMQKIISEHQLNLTKRHVTGSMRDGGGSGTRWMTDQMIDQYLSQGSEFFRSIFQFERAPDDQNPSFFGAD